jgi:arylsulfatase A-like enzyme
MERTRFAKRPNIVLICVDQWRRDCLGIDGHPHVETPYLDQLALQGVRFSRSYAATPSCIPARAALLTGLNQSHHGRIGYLDNQPWHYPTTIGGEFTRHGYETQAIGKLHCFPERSQMGFQNVLLHDGFVHAARKGDRDLEMNDDYLRWLRRELGSGVDLLDHGLDTNGVTTRPWDKPEYTHPSSWVASEAVQFVRRRDRNKPFFLYLGFHRPHPPYDPPAWAFEQYRDQDMEEPPRGDWIGMLEDQRNDHLHNATVARYPRRILDRARAGYWGSMTHIDHQLNRLYEELARTEDIKNTWICFVSDHGEMLGDHDLYRKTFPYEGSAGVPLIIRPPAASGIEPNRRLDAVVELQDIMPTLLDCAGLPVPAGIDGSSLLPVIRGEATSVRSWLHGEHTALGQSIQWLTDGHEKYIWWSGNGQEQLFDLDDDPEELRDLAPVRTDRVAVWRRRLVDQLAGREDGHSDGERLIPGRAVQPILPNVLSSFQPAV